MGQSQNSKDDVMFNNSTAALQAQSKSLQSDGAAISGIVADAVSAAKIISYIEGGQFHALPACKASRDGPLYSGRLALARRWFKSDQGDVPFWVLSFVAIRISC